MTTCGAIKHVVHDKGFGFITGDDGSDYFFHHSEVALGVFAELQPGVRVRFSPTAGPKGARAEAVQRV